MKSNQKTQNKKVGAPKTLQLKARVSKALYDEVEAACKDGEAMAVFLREAAREKLARMKPDKKSRLTGNLS